MRLKMSRLAPLLLIRPLCAGYASRPPLYAILIGYGLGRNGLEQRNHVVYAPCNVRIRSACHSLLQFVHTIQL